MLCSAESHFQHSIETIYSAREVYQREIIYWQEREIERGKKRNRKGNKKMKKRQRERDAEGEYIRTYLLKSESDVSDVFPCDATDSSRVPAFDSEQISLSRPLNGNAGSFLLFLFGICSEIHPSSEIP